MRRPTPEQIDDGILDVAAGVFAKYGYEQTSVQRIADEVGYSKTGLLHRFASKDAIKASVRARCLAEVGEVVAASRDLPIGPERDRVVIETLCDSAIRHPGTVAMLATSGIREPDADEWAIPDAKQALEEAFGVDAATPLARRVRIVGCLGALVFGVLALVPAQTPHRVRDELVATCLATLGH